MGTFDVSAVVLPTAWRDVFNKDGKLIEEDKFGMIPQKASEEKTTSKGFMDEINVSLAKLFAGWEAAAENRRLIKEKAEKAKDEGKGDKTVLTAEMQVMAQKLLTGGEEAKGVFSEIAKRVEKFPELDESGMRSDKKGVKSASFGKARTPVEIKEVETCNGKKIEFTFGGLDINVLRKAFSAEYFSALDFGTFEGCFRKGAGDDRFVLEVLLDKSGEVNVTGKIVKYDVGKGCLVDSFPYLGPEFAELRGKLMNLISNRVRTLPYFYHQLTPGEALISDPKPAIKAALEWRGFGSIRYQDTRGRRGSRGKKNRR